MTEEFEPTKYGASKEINEKAALELIKENYQRLIHIRDLLKEEHREDVLNVIIAHKDLLMKVLASRAGKILTEKVDKEMLKDLK